MFLLTKGIWHLKGSLGWRYIYFTEKRSPRCYHGTKTTSHAISCSTSCQNRVMEFCISKKHSHYVGHSNDAVFFFFFFFLLHQCLPHAIMLYILFHFQEGFYFCKLSECHADHKKHTILSCYFSDSLMLRNKSSFTNSFSRCMKDLQHGSILYANKGIYQLPN